MIKVLQILPGLNRGGLETFVMNVYRNIDRSKIQFEFLTNAVDGDYSDEIKSLGGIIHYIPPRRKGINAFMRNLNAFFKENADKYKAVHYHESSLSSLEVLYYAKKYKIPIRIIHSHSSSISGSKLHYITHYLGKLMVKHLANVYYGCSDKALDWMFKFSGVRNKATLINNGINTNDFSFNESSRKKYRSELNIEGSLTIGHIGRFCQVKNHSFLLKIFKSLTEIRPDSRMILVGVGELTDIVKEEAVDLGISDKILFLGLRTDTAQLLQAMDAFVMPSFFEGLPVVLVEAQTSGLPIICSDTVSDMSRIIPEYCNMSLNDSAKLWADKILDITSRTVRKNRQNLIVAAGFDIKDTANKLSTLYLS